MVNPTSSTPLLTRRAFLVNPSLLWKTGAIFASVGIIAGAFGAHGLRKRSGMTADKIHAWETASSYAVYNGLALLLVSLHPRFGTHRLAGPAIAVGGFVFSSSIMTLVLAGERWKFLGPVTPVGGMAMIAGYVSLIF
ncbi:hypothetical protein BDQ17DRAFT_1294906 [Cyathus striatus]|nr:hypothetical protein BDQ17DRAFT_1294906 [Cyathus striatus]